MFSKGLWINIVTIFVIGGVESVSLHANPGAGSAD